MYGVLPLVYKNENDTRIYQLGTVDKPIKTIKYMVRVFGICTLLILGFQTTVHALIQNIDFSFRD